MKGAILYGVVINVHARPSPAVHQTLTVCLTDSAHIESLAVDIPAGWCVEFGDFVEVHRDGLRWTPCDGTRMDVPIPRLGRVRRTA